MCRNNNTYSHEGMTRATELFYSNGGGTDSMSSL